MDKIYENLFVIWFFTLITFFVRITQVFSGETGTIPLLDWAVIIFFPIISIAMYFKRENELKDNHVSLIQSEVEHVSNKLKQTLDSFGVNLQIKYIDTGLRLFRFNCRVADSKQINLLLDLKQELQIALLLSKPVLIDVLDEHENIVSIWIPKKDGGVYVNWKDDFDNKPLEVTLGQDINGTDYVVDFAKETSLLIAGTTGSGKSLFLESIINSLMLKNDSEHLKFVFIDTKKVQLSHYKVLPHALLPVEWSPAQAMTRLQWVKTEKDRRKVLFSEAKVKDVNEYRDYSKSTKGEILPQIVIVIEDFSDLINVEEGVGRLIMEIATEGAESGICILTSTSRPSQNVCRPEICAAFSNRLVGLAGSEEDSVRVIGITGAEKLLGSGDALVLSSSQNRITRIQGYYLSEDKIISNISLT